MIGLPLVFLGGLLGSAHCVGMCGGFALLIGSGTRSTAANLTRQLIYSAGRIFTYGSIGAAVGFAGLRLAVDAPAVIHVQALLAIVAGVLLSAQGLAAAGILTRARLRSAWAHFRRQRQQLALPVLGQSSSGGGCLATTGLAAFLRSPGWGSVFLAGMLTGFLPCGLVYAYLALAASAADFVGGMMTMAVFGLGTVPLMVTTGCGASLLSVATRQRLYRLAAWCVVLTGLLSTARGLSFLDLGESAAGGSCPMCLTDEHGP
jgi:uncharacterized protein